jgi:Tfp pilus assembly protein PilZ
VSGDGSERREFPRIPLLSEAWIHDDDKRVHVRTRDLSEGGLCIEANEDAVYPPGRSLRLTVKLPESNEEIEVSGRVQWVNGNLLGVSFAGIDKTEKELIRLTVDQLLRDLESMEQEKTPT